MNQNLNINDRIQYLIDSQYNGNKKKFAEKIGFAPQVVSNIVSGRKTKPSFDVLSAISSTIDDVNSEWLLTGEGEMLKKDAETSTTTQEPPAVYQASNSNKLESRLLELLEQKDQEIAELKKELNHKNDLECQRMAESYKKLKE